MEKVQTDYYAYYNSISKKIPKDVRMFYGKSLHDALIKSNEVPSDDYDTRL